jgi:hypothetical protein
MEMRGGHGLVHIILRDPLTPNVSQALGPEIDKRGTILSKLINTNFKDGNPISRKDDNNYSPVRRTVEELGCLFLSWFWLSVNYLPQLNE